jgi:hypothetical protein
MRRLVLWIWGSWTVLEWMISRKARYTGSEEQKDEMNMVI